MSVVATYKQRCDACDGALFSAAASYCPWCGAAQDGDIADGGR